MNLNNFVYGQRTQPYIDNIKILLQNEILNERNRNILRNYLFQNCYINNSFENENFYFILQCVVLLIESSNNNVNNLEFQNLFINVIKDYLKLKISEIVDGNSNLFYQLSNQEKSEIQQQLSRRNQIYSLIKQTEARLLNQTMFNNQAMHNTYNTYNNNNNNNSFQNTTAFSGLNNFNNQQFFNNGQINNNTIPFNNGLEFNDHILNNNNNVVNSNLNQKVAVNTIADKKENNDGYCIKGAYDEIKIENGSVIRPAFKSGWEWTSSKELPYKVHYNPNKVILFYNKTPMGEVLEIHQLRENDMTGEMNYLEHELDFALRQKRNLENSKVVNPTFEIITKNETVSVFNDEEEEIQISVGNIKSIIDYPITTFNFNDGVNKALLILSHSFGSDIEIENVEFSLNLSKSFLNNSEYAQLELIDNLCKIESALGKYEYIENHQEYFSRNIFIKFEENLTKELLKVINYDLAFNNWTFDSAIKDFEELRNLVKSHSKDLVKFFDNGFIHSVRKTLSYLKGKQFKNYLISSEIDFSFDVFKEDVDLTNDIIILTTHLIVNHIPYNLEELQLNFDSWGIVPESHEQFKKYLHSILEKGKELNQGLNSYLIVTKDKEILEFRKGLLVPNSILLFKH